MTTKSTKNKPQKEDSVGPSPNNLGLGFIQKPKSSEITEDPIISLKNLLTLAGVLSIAIYLIVGYKDAK